MRYPNFKFILGNLLMKNSFIAATLVSMLSLIVGFARADEVTLPYKGLTLNANLELARNKTISNGVILITHGGLAHRDMEIITYLQKLLNERGYNTLAINLSLGLNNRHGMYDCAVTQRHTNDDAADEIGTWVAWLKKEGATRVALLGHSRGGAQTALYAARPGNTLVKAVVLMSPATRDNTSAVAYLSDFQQPLPPLLEQAQKLRQSGKGNAVLNKIGLMTCRDTSATADSFVSYYAPEAQARLDTPALLSKITQPVLVTVASDDAIVVGLERKIAPLADGKHVQMKVIQGADHLYRDLSTDDAVDVIDAFLKSVGYAVQTP